MTAIAACSPVRVRPSVHLLNNPFFQLCCCCSNLRVDNSEKLKELRKGERKTLLLLVLLLLGLVRVLSVEHLADL